MPEGGVLTVSAMDLGDGQVTVTFADTGIGMSEEDVASNGKQVVVLSRLLAQNQAYRLKEDFGTKPRVYYIAGHGEAVGRDVFTGGRLPTEWPWVERVKGARTWKR